jgi:GGDEF domain-containing protein
VDENLKAKILSTSRSGVVVYIFCLLLSLPFAMFAAALITPFFTPMLAEATAYGIKAHINNGNGGHDINSLEAKSLVERFNLSWLYVTDGSTKPAAETARYIPYMTDYPMRSGTINLRGVEHYESVVPLSDGYMLHVGMDNGYPDLPLSAMDDFYLFFNMPFKGLSVLLIFAFSALLNYILLNFILLKPVQAFARDIRQLSETGAPSLVAFDKIKLAPEASSILWQLKGAIHKLLAQIVQTERERDSIKEQTSAKDGPWHQPSPKEVQEMSNPSLPRINAVKATVHSLRALKQSEESYGENICEGVMERFPGLVSGVVFMKGDTLEGKSTSSSIVSTAGLRESQIRELRSLNLTHIFDQARTAGKAITLGPMSLKRSGLDALMERLDAHHVVLAPIRHRRRCLGYLLVLTNVALGPDQIRALERLLDQTSSVYHGLLLREAKEEKVWTDPLTDLRNRAYLQEVVSDLTNTIGVTSGQTYAIAYFSINAESGNIDGSVDNYALAVTVALKHLRNSQMAAKLGDLNKLEFIRAQQLEFAVLMKGENESFYEECCLELGRLLETSMRVEKTVQHHLVISLGLAIFPFDALKGEDVLSRAKLAMVYAENLARPDQRGALPNALRVTLSLAKARFIPAEFKPQRKFMAVKGELGALDGAEIIQSVASGNRSGILSVEDGASNRNFVLLIADGKPIGAALGKLIGLDALVEFISTYETGSFNFVEKENMDSEVPAIPRQAMPSLMNSLMDAALAADNYTSARHIIKDLKTPVIACYTEAGWNELLAQEQPGEREQHLLKEIMKMADGKTNLDTIFAVLNYCPTAIVWHATALLANHGQIDYVRQRAVY